MCLKKRLLVPTVAALAASLMLSTAGAVELGDRFELHGYGHMGYFKSTKLDFGDATTDGSWNGMTSLLVVGKLTDRSKVWVQLHNTAERSKLDWAFVDFNITPQFVVRTGQIKMPVGWYTEIIDASFLRQSTIAPLMYQEGAGFVFENYRGVDATYNLDAGKAGNLAIKGYVGQVVGEPGDDSIAHKALSGVQLTYTTPVDGLKLMASAYQAKMNVFDSNLPTFGLNTRKTGVLSAEYNNDPWDIKAEVAQSRQAGIKNTASYIQAAYTVAGMYTPFVRVDKATLLSGSADRSTQDTVSLGLTVRLNDHVALRLEGQRHNGVALPVAEWLGGSFGGTLNAADKPQSGRWSAFGLSMNFLF